MPTSDNGCARPLPGAVHAAKWIGDLGDLHSLRPPSLSEAGMAGNSGEARTGAGSSREPSWMM